MFGRAIKFPDEKDLLCLRIRDVDCVILDVAEDIAAGTLQAGLRHSCFQGRDPVLRLDPEGQVEPCLLRRGYENLEVGHEGFLLLDDNELDAPVLFAPDRRLVRSDWTCEAEAHRFHAVGRYASLD